MTQFLEWLTLVVLLSGIFCLATAVISIAVT
jgi:hypothetical protein